MLFRSRSILCYSKTSDRLFIWILRAIFCLFLLNDLSNFIQFTEARDSSLAQIISMIRENNSSIETKCETYGCVKVAKQIIGYIDDSIDPCDNFYAFANGHYINDVADEAVEDESRSFASTVTSLVQKKVGPLLSKPIHPNEWKPFQLAKKFYKSCLDQRIFVRRGNQQLIDILDSVGGWPVINGKSWQSSKFDLIELIEKVKSLGFGTDSILTLTVGTEFMNNTNKMLHITKGNYLEDEIKAKKRLTKYRNLMFTKTAIFTDKNDGKEKTRIRKEMNLVLAFEEKLVKISSNPGEYEEDEEDDIVSEEDTENNIKDNIHYGPYTTIKEVQKSYPYMNWLRYINAILPSGMNVTENETIMFWDWKFFKNLGKVMKKTSERTIANHIVWRTIYEAYKMQTFARGNDRRKKCISLTSEKFSIPVGLLYSRKYFNEESREVVIDLVEDVRNAFIDILGEATWMDAETREKAINKAKNIVAHVGYPKELYENDELNEYYEHLEMESDTFFENSLQLNLLTNDQLFKTLRKPVNRSGWERLLDVNPAVVNAFFYYNETAMKFPIAILQEIYFSADRPQYINYASLGYVVGHEITHGFDNKGREYDLNGNLIDWWNPETEIKFEEKTKCLINQYNHYLCPRINKTLNGVKTLSENIADNGGTRAAYLAYQYWIERNGPEKLVPGVQYNQNQLFWISFAQAQSSFYNEDILKDRIENGVHAPEEFRVNGVVTNIREFAIDFNCPVGSKMNPTKKCRVW